MNTAPKERSTAGQAPRLGQGATALGADQEGRPRRHPRHVPGNALRAVRVFAETAFSVVVLGDYDARPPTREASDRVPAQRDA